MTMRFLPHLLRRFVKRGQLTVFDHDGTKSVFGPGGDGPSVTVRCHDAKVERDIFFNPELAIAETWMDGRLDFEDGSTIYDLLSLFWMQRKELRKHPLQRAVRAIRFRIRRWQMRNPLGLAAKNVRHHYDIPPEFYKLWLDSNMNYSCAYWRTPDVGLEQAQSDKLRHIAAKLNLKPGMSVLDIGSGWGQLAIYLARATGARVTGLNVSPEQIRVARERAIEAGVGDLVTFVEQDYRELQGQFDRIVSVGMMEHVGIAHYDEYFSAIKRLLKPDGSAMVHSICRVGPPGFTGPFFQKYIFPGGYAPAPSEVFESLQKQGLWTADVEFLRLHYYWTLKAWRERFLARRPEVVAMLDERFARMWEFYLSACEISFHKGGDMVMQVLFAPERDGIPVIRDFIFDNERALEERGH
jgi:cyclopropane-fatty-acyl-phospholipid synthase